MSRTRRRTGAGARRARQPAPASPAVPARRPGIGPFLAALALGAALASPACVGLSKGSLFPEDGDEVWVEYFENRTFYRDTQFLLTEQVVAEVLSRPGLRLSRNAEEAEVILRGRVIQVRQSVLSEDAARAITSGNSTVTAVVDVVDAATGEILRSREITHRGEFVPPLAETDESARREVFELLARDIVRVLETEF